MSQPSVDPIKTVAVVLMDESGHVLLVRHGEGAKHQTGVYGFPAGKIESDETAEQAAIRELQEETGLLVQLESLQKLPKVYYADIELKAGTKHFSMEVYVGTEYEGDLVATDKTEPAWVAIADVPELETLPNVPEVVIEVMAYAASLT